MMTRKFWNVRFVFAALLAGLLALITQANANAALMLRLTAGSGPTVTVTDNLAGDDSGTTGRIEYSAAIGGFTVNLTTVLSKPVLTEPQERVTNINVAGTVADTLLIEVVDDGFAPIGPGFWIVSNSADFLGDTTATPASSVSFAAFVDPTDSGAFSTGIVLPAGTLSGPAGGSFLGFAPHGSLPTFSMGLTAFLTLEPMVNTNFGVAISNRAVPQGIPLVPEPASMAIWGIGAVGLAFAGYRRRRVSR